MKLSHLLLSFLINFCVLNCSDQVFAQGTKKPSTPVKITKEQADEMEKTANTLYKESNYKAALEQYTKLVNFDPEDGNYNYKLGMCYMNSNSDKSQAVQYFVKAADKKDAPKDVYYYMGR